MMADRVDFINVMVKVKSKEVASDDLFQSVW